MQSLTLTLPAEATSASLMRERLWIWLDETGVDEEYAVDLVVACSEAFANAVQHPLHPVCHTVDVEAELRDEAIVLRVHDSGMPQLAPFASRPGHYGLVLMRGLMDSVDVQRSSSGTTVTLQRALSPREPDPARSLRLV